MFSPSYLSYRGCQIRVHVSPVRSYSLGGVYRRYRVAWTVSAVGDPDQEIASFPEQFEFINQQEAVRYAVNLAHTFIDSMLRTPSQTRLGGDGFEQADNSPHV
jgi:hypothetical protein